MKINISSNIEGATPYQSAYEVQSGGSVEIRAREVKGYKFTKWSDGNTDNPRTLTPTNDIYLIAQYEKLLKNETYYQYRGFIKDQLDMEAKPKAFVLAKNDNDKEDLITKATTTIQVQAMPSNVNEGDVIVLYTPKGTRYYQGVISKISETKITCNQMASFFKGTFNKSIINHLTNTSGIEKQIAEILMNYQEGKYYGVGYIDTLIAQRLGSFTVQYVSSQTSSLPKDKDDSGNDKNTQYDMEQFIYDMYNEYGVLCEFTVNFEGTNYLKVFTPTYSQITIGNNQNAITNLSPITTIEQTNKLIIFNQNGSYRTTFVARKDGEIVEAPTSIANRFEIVNTKIVKSDDSNDTLIKANLPTKMYNHKLSFSLLTENNLYDWQDLKLGMPLHIFIDGNFFDSVLTGREIIHNENQNIKQVNYTCGMVRIDLTQQIITRLGRN